mmetsp:Transcript_23271/g.66248  ORF Transcript_23271/g.66248 Transcript_23271/m.66248 type:complete len:214 (+) Transcript_23271:1020-1661(+)
MSPFSVSMSVSSPCMASEFSLIFSLMSLIVLSNVSLVFAHSASSSSLLPLNSLRRSVKVSMMPWEWYWYSGSPGSTLACSIFVTCCRRGSEMPAAAPEARTRCTADLTSTSIAGLESSMAFIAPCSDEIALARSAASASYCAVAFSRRTFVSSSSAVQTSFFCLRSFRSACLLWSSADFSWIVDEKPSMLSLPSVMAFDFDIVVSLQKQEKVS